MRGGDLLSRRGFAAATWPRIGLDNANLKATQLPNPRPGSTALLAKGEGKYLASGVPVGRHLADQIMLPLGIGAYLDAGGGAFRTLALSAHATTHLEILRHFLGLDARIEQNGPDDYLLRIGPQVPTVR